VVFGIIFLTFLAIPLFCLECVGGNSLTDYSWDADSFSYSENNSTIHAQGNVCLSSSSLLLVSDVMRWTRSTNHIEAKGSVVLTQNGMRILADQISYSLNLGDYNASDIRMGLGDLLVEAGEINQRGGNLNATNISMYLNEPHALDPGIKIGKLSYDFNSTVLALTEPNLVFNELSILELPNYSFKNDEYSFSPKLKIGKQGSLGWYSGLELGRKLTEGRKAELEIYGFEKRGLFLGPKFSHYTSRLNGFSETQFHGGWIRDQATEIGLDSGGYRIKDNRAFTRLSSIHRIQNHVRVALKAEWDSDSEVYRDFKRNRFEQNQWNDSFAEITHNGEYYSVTFLANEQINNHEGMIKKSPQVAMRTGPNLALGFYHTSSIQYSNSELKNSEGATAQSLEEFDLGYRMQKKLKLADGIYFIPSIAFRHNEYELDDFTQKRTLGEWSNDLIINLTGTKQVGSEMLEVDQLIHSMNFSMGHRRIVRLNGDADLRDYSSFYSSENLNLDPLNLLDNSKTAEISPSEVVRLGWRHNWSGEWDKKYRRLATAQFFYDLVEIKGGDAMKSRPFYGNLLFLPDSMVNIKARSKVDLRSGKSHRHALGIGIRDGRFHEAEIMYHRYLNTGEYIKFESKKLVNEKMTTTFLASYDLKYNRLPLWRIALQIRPGWSWIWDFSLSEYRNTAKENNLSFNIGVKLARF